MLLSDFVVYQIDVKSAFLYGNIKEEVYVCQPLGFEDPGFPYKVYNVKKALCGLHQAPRAWYETLSTYLLDNWFHRGKIDKTLFIRKYKVDILLVQVYVDDIIFEVKNVSTPMETQKHLLKNEDGKEVDVHMYRSMIGSLMYLTSSRPDIMLVVCACARYQINPKVSHFHAVKRNFRYLKGQLKFGLRYPKDSSFDLIAYTDSDYPEITVEVLEIYMHQFWNTIKIIGKTNSYNFKLNKKKCRVGTKVFHEILQICPRLPNQYFVELPFEDDLLSFIKELGYSGNCEMLFTIHTGQMHHP
nr:hypothetical protein [Tanacetum cinerariifolium]